MCPIQKQIMITFNEAKVFILITSSEVFFEKVKLLRNQLSIKEELKRAYTYEVVLVSVVIVPVACKSFELNKIIYKHLQTSAKQFLTRDSGTLLIFLLRGLNLNEFQC